MTAAKKAAPAAPKQDATKERSALIKLIHVGRKKLAMDDGTWRMYLQSAFKVQSSTQLSLPQLKAALAHLRRVGFKAEPAADAPAHEWTWVDAAPLYKRPLLRKIIKLCQAIGVEKGRQVVYVEGIARQMRGANSYRRGKVEVPLQMVEADDLLPIVQALAIHLKRTTGSEADA